MLSSKYDSAEPDHAPQHWGVAGYAFSFIQKEILPHINGLAPHITIRFQLVHNDAFEAQVRPPREGADYEVRLFTGLIDELYKMLSSVREQPGKALYAERMDKYGLRGRKRLFNLVYLYSVLWVCLHETAHVLAGHVDFWAKLAKSGNLGFTELSETEAETDLDLGLLRGTSLDHKGAAIIDDMCRVRELEADGYAMEIMHDWRFPAAAMLVEEEIAQENMYQGALHPRHQQKVGRLLLFAALCCGLLLEKHRRSAPGIGDSEYPFPEARMANIATRFVMRACGSTFERKMVYRDGSLYLSRTFSEAEAMNVAQALIVEVLPALAWTQDLANSTGIDLSLFDRKEHQLDSKTGLWRDIRALVTGQPATSTTGGRELMRVSDTAEAFDAAVSSYRLCRWGSA